NNIRPMFWLSTAAAAVLVMVGLNWSLSKHSGPTISQSPGEQVHVAPKTQLASHPQIDKSKLAGQGELPQLSGERRDWSHSSSNRNQKEVAAHVPGVKSTKPLTELAVRPRTNQGAPSAEEVVSASNAVDEGSIAIASLSEPESYSVTGSLGIATDE